jgi:hypothetical protein
MLVSNVGSACVICKSIREPAYVVHEGPRLFCQQCVNRTQHLDLTDAALRTAVSSSTMYRWMRLGLIHWATLPCGHRVVCENSLSTPGHHSATGDKAKRFGPTNVS